MSRPVNAAHVIWMLPSLTCLVILACVWVQGLFVSNLAYLILGVVAIICSALMTLLRERSMRAIGGLKHASLVAAIRDIVLLGITIVLAFLLIELPWNVDLLAMRKLYVAINLVLLAIPFVIAFLLGNRRGGVLVIPLAICFVLGWAQYFIELFKGAAIRPSDLLALNTALSVSGGYRFEIGALQVATMVLFTVGVGLLSFMAPMPAAQEKQPRSAALLGVRVGLSCICLVATVMGFNGANLSHEFGFTTAYFDSLNVYRSQGFTASFISLLQNARIPKPEGYSEGDAQALLDSLVQEYETTLGADDTRHKAESQFAEIRPTVIAIMNESFSDLSIFNGMNAGYTGPEFVNGLDDALYRGYVYSSVIAGGTCNSEFEFLTGASMAFVGTENQPYVMYGFEDVSTLPRQFEDMGYASCAIHPMSGENWNRKKVYSEMGFDSFLDIESFESDVPVRHAGPTDAATYQLVLDQLEQSEVPGFIFDVTVQNHGAYDVFDLPDDERVDSNITWVDGLFPEQTAEYISLIAASDRELETFINELRTIDRPVVVVFFGDHQPIHGQILNEVLYPGADPNDPSHFERMYQVPYFIWANYNVAGNDQASERLDVGINSLAAVTLNSIGAPLTDWQMAQLVLREDVPVLNGFGYQTSDGAWHSLEGEQDWARAVRDLEWIQYLEYASNI